MITMHLTRRASGLDKTAGIFKMTMIAGVVFAVMGGSPAFVSDAAAREISASITQAIDGEGGELSVSSGQTVVSGNGAVTNFESFKVNDNLIVTNGGSVSSAGGTVTVGKGIEIRKADGSNAAGKVEVGNIEVTDHRISNSGTLIVHGNAVSKINQADASGEVNNETGASMTVTGNITAEKQLTNKGTLKLNGTNQTLSGAKWYNTGSATISGNADASQMVVENKGGTIKSDDANQGALVAQTLTNLARDAQGAQIELKSLTVLDRLSNDAKSSIKANALSVGGLFENSGTVEAGSLTATGDNIIRNQGTLTVSGAISGQSAALEVKGGTVSASAIDLQKVQILAGGTLSMTGEGKISVAEKLENLGRLEIGDSLVAESAWISNNGELVRKNGGAITLIKADRFDNAAGKTVNVAKLDVEHQVNNSGTLTVVGDVLGGDLGQFINQQGGTVEIGGNLHIGTGIQAGHGNGVVNLGTLRLTGTDQVIETNVLYNGKDGKILAQNGSLTVEADVQNSGTIAKSDSEALTVFKGRTFINNTGSILKAKTVELNGAMTNLGTIEGGSVASASFENRGGAVTVDRVETQSGPIANSGTMTVTGDLMSANHVNNADGTLSVGGSVQAAGQIAVTKGELKLTSEDASLSAASVYNTGSILGAKQITVEKGTLTNKGRVAGLDDSELALLTAGEVVNEAGATICVKDMKAGGMVTNLGTVSASGALEVETLGNSAGSALTAGSLTTTKADHEGHLSNEGKMTVAGKVEVRGHFGNLGAGEFKAGTLTTSNATDEGKSFEVDELELLVSPETDKGLGFFDFMSESSVAKVGTLTTANGQLKVFGKGVEIGTVADASNVIVQVDDFTPGKAKIGTNNGSMTVEISSDMAEELNPDDLATGMQKAADTVAIENGRKEKSVTAPSSTIMGELTAQTDANGRIVFVNEAPNAFNVGVSEMASTAMLAWRAENNDMFKRLGDLRRGDDNNGIWARVMAGESKFGTQNLKNEFTTLQFGYDHRVGAANEWVLGGAFTYTKGDSTFDYGTGDNYQFGFALYGSYLAESGGYVDVIGKYSRLKNEYDAFGGVGSGEYYGNGLSVSVEAGHRFDAAWGLYVEPQVEFTYGYLTDADYVTSAGAAVEQDSMKSAVGRVGFNVGKTFEKGSVHAGVSWLKDWEGETSVRMSYLGQARSFAQDLGDDWVEFEVGGSYDLRDNLKLYGTFETTTGGDVKTPWLANVGVRLVW